MIENLRHRSTMRKCQWKDVRDEVGKKNPELAKIIDDLNPGEKYPLFEVTYPFGTEILKNGILQLPTMSDEVDTAPFTDSRYFDSKLQEQLGYNSGSNPVSFILEGQAELFFELQNRIIPFSYGLIPPGKLFGLWRILGTPVSHSSAFLWHMTAGARSIGMLAKISHARSHNKLAKLYGITQELPGDLWDHWAVFRQLYQSENFGESWKLKIIFFSQEWFGESFLKDPKWMPFRCYGFDMVCRTSDFQRNKPTYDLIFSLLEERGKFKINPFAWSMAKHIMYLAMGEAIAFAPIIDDFAGPIERLQKIYSDDYGLSYAPIIMGPHVFSANDERAAYVSLAYPTIPEFARKVRALSSKVSDLWQVEYYIKKYEYELRNQNINISDIPLYGLFDRINVSFYHADNKAYKEILHTSEILKDDPYLLSPKYCQGKPFPELNVFTRGCIKIAHKKTKNVLKK